MRNSEVSMKLGLSAPLCHLVALNRKRLTKTRHVTPGLVGVVGNTLLALGRYTGTPLKTNMTLENHHF